MVLTEITRCLSATRQNPGAQTYILRRHTRFSVYRRELLDGNGSASSSGVSLSRGTYPSTRVSALITSDSQSRRPSGAPPLPWSLDDLLLRVPRRPRFLRGLPTGSRVPLRSPDPEASKEVRSSREHVALATTQFRHTPKQLRRSKSCSQGRFFFRHRLQT